MKFKSLNNINERIAILMHTLNVPPGTSYFDLPNFCNDIEFLNDIIIPNNINCSMFDGKIINIDQPADLQRFFICEELLTLMTCIQGFDSKKYKLLHPNRLKLKYFWIYRLNLLDKSAKCYQSIDPSSDSNESEEDPIFKILRESLYKKFGHPSTESDLVNSETHCCNTTSANSTCPPCTPTQHGDDSHFGESRYCWGHFVSKCDECEYKVWETKQGDCLACYYFGAVLNELHEKWACRSKVDRSIFLIQQ